jgi:hypothetical protein
VGLEDLEQALRGLGPGHRLQLPYGVFDLMFPSSAGHPASRAKAMTFARNFGVRVEDHPDDEVVWFYKSFDNF